MKYTAILASVGLAAAGLVERDVNPTSATLALFSALPTSLQQLALTNSASAAAVISSELTAGTGLPDWFKSLPGDVQTYFITMGGAATASGSGPKSTGGANSTTTTTKTTSSGSSSKTGGSSTSGSSGSSSTGSGSSGSSSSSSAGAAGAFPTAVIGSGIAGALGVIGMLAL